jgi:hypothetical protein
MWQDPQQTLVITREECIPPPDGVIWAYLVFKKLLSREFDLDLDFGLDESIDRTLKPDHSNLYGRFIPFIRQ